MKPNRFLKAAAVLWALAVLAAAVWPGAALARYTALATGAARATVAKWNVRGVYTGETEGDNLALVFKEDENGVIARVFTVTLYNSSDVTARCKLVPGVDSGGIDLANDIAIAVSAADEADYPEGYDMAAGIVLPAAAGAPASVELEVTVSSADFKGLRFDAQAVQVN